jgi:hypothetical protein
VAFGGQARAEGSAKLVVFLNQEDVHGRGTKSEHFTYSILPSFDFGVATIPFTTRPIKIALHGDEEQIKSRIDRVERWRICRVCGPSFENTVLEIDRQAKGKEENRALRADTPIPSMAA